MANTTTANLQGILARTYTRDNWWVPFERHATKFLDRLEDFAQNDEPLGEARYFRLWLSDAQASGSVAEEGQLPTPGQPNVQQGLVNAIQVASAFGLSELMLEAARNGGVLDTDLVHAHVEMCTRNLFSDINRYTVAGHATARLAVVEASVGAGTTFVAALNQGVNLLRRGMEIVFYDLDSGGSIQDGPVGITGIDYATRTVTVDAAITVTADDSVYKAISATVDTYGIAPNGLRGIADDGTLQAVIYGLDRTVETKLQAQILTAGAPRDYTEKLVRQGLHRLYHEVGVDDEDMELWTNTGVLSEHYQFTTAQRRYNIGLGREAPTYDIGAQEKPVFHYMGQGIPIECDGDIPARELYIVTIGMYRRHILRRASWVGDDTGIGGAASPILMQVPGTDNYKLSKVAGQVWMGNTAHLMPAALVRIEQIKDEELAGDT